MKMRLFLLSIFLTFNSFLQCATRTPLGQQTSIPIIMVPVALRSPAHHYPAGVTVNRPEENEPNWFPHLMSIFANIGIIFLDPKNIVHVKQQVAKLLDNLQALVHEITKRSYSKDERRFIMNQLAERLQLLATQLPEPIFIKEYEPLNY